MLSYFLLPALAAAAASLNDYPRQPQIQTCGAIVNDNLYNGTVWFEASQAIECLTSVPFNDAVATRFVKYWNQTLQFQSTTAYLKNPPQGYQRPAFDVPAALTEVQNRINSGYYHNQYAFEADLQSISLNIHDSHAYLYAGIFEAFSFSIPYYLYTASSDGKALPDIYVFGGDTDAAIDTIAGTPAVKWLEDFASKEAFGFVEANADWNQLMLSPAQFIIGATNPLSGGGTFYFGDTLDITYKDGTSETWTLLAYYNSPGFTGPLATGGDFYNFFVLGNTPANYDETYEQYIIDQNITFTDLDIDTCGDLTSWYDVTYGAYPNDTLTHQDCLGLYEDGSITSYYLSDISTGVLSLPTFEDPATYPGTFSQAVDDFIANATQKGAKRVIIDLQQNGGGEVGLAFQVYGKFFPKNEPYAGSRMRYHDLMNQFGTTLTAYFQQLNSSNDDFPILVADEFVVTDRLNAATNQNFQSWQEFAGPVTHQGDTFSLIERYNLTDVDFLTIATGLYASGCYYGDCEDAAPWKAEDIIILTDGTCASACTLFVEQMVERGVRTVAVGGQPQNGPMQAASGSRGAVAYSADLLDLQALLTQTVNSSAATNYDTDTGMVTDLAGFTLRDQLRQNNDVPLQFQYLPANCRIFWTVDNAADYTRLWHDTYQAIYGNASNCIPGSVNAAAPPTNSTIITLPKVPSPPSPAKQILHGLGPAPVNSATDGNPGNFIFCDRGQGKRFQSDCGSAGTCTPINLSCDNKQDPNPAVNRFICIPNCRNLDSTSNSGCPNAGSCARSNQKTQNSGKQSSTGKAGKSGVTVTGGQCIPDKSRDHTACARIRSTAQGPVPLS